MIIFIKYYIRNLSRNGRFNMAAAAAAAPTETLEDTVMKRDNGVFPLNDVVIVIDLKAGKLTLETLGKVITTKGEKHNTSCKYRGVYWTFHIPFDDDKSWEFKWECHDKHQQFVSWQSYCLNSYGASSPYTEIYWCTYIDKPQVGTCQTRKVEVRDDIRRQVERLGHTYKGPKSLLSTKVKVKVVNSPFGDFSS